MTLREALLADFYSRMTDEERRAYALLKSHDEVLDAVRSQQSSLDRLEKKVGWWPEFSNNVLANLTTDAIGWIGLKLLQKL